MKSLFQIVADVGEPCSPLKCAVRLHSFTYLLFLLEILEWVEKQMKERQGTTILSSGPHGAEGSSAHGQ